MPHIGTDHHDPAFAAYVSRWIHKHLTPLQHKPDFEQWLNTTSYNGKRKEQLREARSKYPIRPDYRKSKRINSFIKQESYPEYKYPRWINSRTDQFKAYSGPFFKAIEEQVFKHHWFIKHVPVLDRASKILGLSKAGARYIQTDFSSFEAHFTPELMEDCEMQLYEYMLQLWPEDYAFLHQVLTGTNLGRTRDGVSFKVQARRMSGEMCTSLGNGFTNLMVWGFICEQLGTSWDGFVEGDDGIFAIYDGPIPTAADYTNRGYNIKLNEYKRPELASFCGVVSVDSSNIKDPIKWLASFATSDRFHTAGHSIRLDLLRAKALSALYETPNCPIIGVVARRALNDTSGHKPRYEEDGYHQTPPKFEIPPFQPTENMRIVFSELYHISPEVQLAIEKRVWGGNYYVADLLNLTMDYTTNARNVIHLPCVNKVTWVALRFGCFAKKLFWSYCRARW